MEIKPNKKEKYMICLMLLALVGIAVVAAIVIGLVWLWPFVLIALGVSGLIALFNK